MFLKCDMDSECYKKFICIFQVYYMFFHLSLMKNYLCIPKINSTSKFLFTKFLLQFWLQFGNISARMFKPMFIGDLGLEFSYIFPFLLSVSGCDIWIRLYLENVMKLSP